MADLKDDSLEQLHIIFHCFDGLSEGVEAFEEVLVQRSLREHED